MKLITIISRIKTNIFSRILKYKKISKKMKAKIKNANAKNFILRALITKIKSLKVIGYILKSK
jgi:hypothetical protein